MTGTPPQVESGLSSDEAARRLAEDGPNDPAPPQRSTWLAAVMHFVGNPLVLLLLAASGASALLRQPVDAAIVAVIVVASVALNFVQTFRSTRAVRRLREHVASRATLLRDGGWRELPVAGLVRGDLVRLSAGDLVPADARLLSSRDLHVHEAALTGESMPVEKHAGEPVFLGTSVASGTGLALVDATGPRTRFGDIALRLMRRPSETEFERGTRRFGALIMKTVFFLVLFIVLVSIAMHRDPLQSLLFAVALAVGLTPEFLPMITTVTLARGAVRMAKQQVIVKQLSAIQNFGSMDILCSDKTGTLTSGTTELVRAVDAAGRPSEEARLCGRLNAFHQTGVASPLDRALLDGGGPLPEWRKTDEIPFDFERRRVSVVLAHDGRFELITKGAPESVLAACAFDGQDRARCQALFEALSAEGLRVLAVARRTVEVAEGLGREDERDLRFVGLLAFADPPRPDAAEAIAALRRDGVVVKILTGDNERVARHVCAEVGLDVARVLTGDELDRVSDAALGPLAEETTVFARLTPAQKNRVLAALRARRHVVGFLGDGINDAPSLRAADVGISVASAVDVAKEAAEVVLLEPGLGVLHAGILEGRRAFGNVLKYLLMGTSSNFGNMFSMAGASLLLPFLPMLPTQILLNNFLYDAAQVTIPTDRVDATLTQKPRRWDIDGVRRFMLWIGPLSSIYDFLTFWVLLRGFHASEPLFHTGWFVESLATQMLVLFVIRTTGRPWKEPPSAPLVVTALMVVALGVALPFTPLAPLLGMVPLPPVFLAFLVAATATYLVLVEAAKRRLMPRLLG